MSDLIECFLRRFHGAKGATYRTFSPYRICPIGAHVDHQYGLITGFAMDHGVELIYQATDTGEVQVFSEDFPGVARFSLLDPVPAKQGDWGDYLRGCVWALSQGKKLWRGIRGVVRGSLPIGGLSSSAAVTLCYLQALMQVNDLYVGAQDAIELAFQVESGYVGVNVGKLDQSCEVLSRKDHLLFLDALDGQYELIPRRKNMPEFDIVVFYSGLSRRLGSGFNNRVDELKAASWFLKGLSGMELGALADSRLRDVPPEVFERYEGELPEPFRRRARHYYAECERVKRGVAAWRAGDIEAFGELVFESGESSIVNYETGSPELIALYRAMREAPGIYGGRFSGAGFRGCCAALVDPTKREPAIEFVTERYLRQFPNLRGAYSTHVCKTEDGVGVQPK